MGLFSGDKTYNTTETNVHNETTNVDRKAFADGEKAIAISGDHNVIQTLDGEVVAQALGTVQAVAMNSNETVENVVNESLYTVREGVRSSSELSSQAIEATENISKRSIEQVAENSDKVSELITGTVKGNKELLYAVLGVSASAAIVFITNLALKIIFDPKKGRSNA